MVRGFAERVLSLRRLWAARRVVNVVAQVVSDRNWLLTHRPGVSRQAWFLGLCVGSGRESCKKTCLVAITLSLATMHPPQSPAQSLFPFIFIPSCNTDQGVVLYEKSFGEKPQGVVKAKG